LRIKIFQNSINCRLYKHQHYKTTMGKILIIDDEKAIRNTLKEILEYEGYIVDEAADGQIGLERIENEEYEAILCDIKMPKMDGLEVLTKARELDDDVPFIMISGNATIDVAVEATKKGAYDFISKPPDLKQFTGNTSQCN
jgi:two-component system nitrogen regulation response regulator NtrX